METKGLEDVNVAGKDRAAHIWCENATRLTGNLVLSEGSPDRLREPSANPLLGLAGAGRTVSFPGLVAGNAKQAPPLARRAGFAPLVWLCD